MSSELGDAGTLALTFDDGPDPRGTPHVLRALADTGAPATFFVIAPRAERHPDLIARMLDDGHVVGLHCDRHVRHSELSREAVVEDATRALARLAKLGLAPALWRTPWGVTGPWTDEVASDLGLRLVGWDVDTHDWRGDPADAMYAATRDRLTSGAVVLAHDGIGPGARREHCLETAAYVGLVDRRAAEHDLELSALS